MKLLEQTVRELKGEEIEDDVRATVNLGVDLRIDESYVSDMNQRLMLYRKVAAARREEEIDRVLEEAEDRYGALPDAVLNLADYGRIRVMADRLGVEAIDREGRVVVLRFRPQAKMDPARLISLVRQRGDLTLAPPASLKLSMEARPSSPSPKPLAPSPGKAGKGWRQVEDRAELVDGTGPGNGSEARLLEGADVQAGRQGRSPGRRRRVRAGRRVVERPARREIRY